MKKIIFKTVLGLSLSALISCGGNGAGSSSKANDFIGKAPGIVIEYNEAKAKLEAEGEEKAQSIKNKDEFFKEMEKFVQKEEAMKQKMEEGLKAEETALKGKDLPIENNNPSIEVTEMKLDEINDTYARFRGSITVKEALPETFVKYQLQDKDGNIIEDKSTYPAVPYEFGAKGIKEGTYEVKTEIKLNNPDAAKLAKVVFIP